MLLEDLFDGKHIMSFEQCVSKYGIPCKDFWKFLQLSSCIAAADRKKTFTPVSCIQELWRSSWKVKGGTSKFYDMFRKHHPQTTKGLS